MEEGRKGWKDCVDKNMANTISYLVVSLDMKGVSVLSFDDIPIIDQQFYFSILSFQNYTNYSCFLVLLIR